MKKLITCVFAPLFLASCISSAPQLTDLQQEKMNTIEVYKLGSEPAKAIKQIAEISGADCSGAPYGGRVWGDSEKAIDVLKAKAAALNADVIVDVSCNVIPLLNNCWAAQKCTGNAATFK